MGHWIYYVTSVRFEDIAHRVTNSNELNSSKALSDLIQRELSDRSKGIASYLLQQKEERFFNALIVASYDGEPRWVDFDIPKKAKGNVLDLDNASRERIGNTIGLLYLSGEEKLFALDGQHRVAGIRAAIKKDNSLNDEEVAVIFVRHDANVKGRIRTRRLFTTLNKYAVKVSPAEIVALDEDDSCAIITRKLLDEHRLLKGSRVTIGEIDPETGAIKSVSKATSIPPSDKTSITTILTINDICNVLLLNREIAGRKWTKEELRWPRPDDAKLQVLFGECQLFWTLMADSFPELQEVRDAKNPNGVAGKYRTDLGGHLLFRPIGQMAFARAVRTLIDQGMSMRAAFNDLRRLEYSLTHEAWSGVLWNKASGTMLTTATSRDVASGLMLHFLGKNKKEGLLKKYLGLKLIEDEAATLPSMTLKDT